MSTSMLGRISVSLYPTQPSAGEGEVDGVFAAIATLTAALAGKASNASVEAKADADATTAALDVLTAAVALRATSSSVAASVASLTASIGTKADSSAMTTALAAKADAAATTAALNTLTAAVAAIGTGSISGLDAAIATLSAAVTALLASDATQSTQIGGKADAAATAASLALKVDTTVMTAALALKADTSALAAKADSSTVTAALADKADTSALTSGLAGKADTSALAAKADASALTSGLASKADTSALTSGLAGKADASALAAKADASALTSGLAGKVSTGEIGSGLSAETASIQAVNPDAEHLFGFDADGIPLVKPLALEALATAADVINGGASKVTSQTLKDLATVRELFVVGGVLEFELGKIAVGKYDLGLHGRVTTNADFLLKALALPVGLDDAEVCGTLVVSNSHASVALKVNLPHALVDGASAIEKIFDVTASPQMWEAGSLALRSVPAGQSRTFEYRARRGKVTWKPLPLNLMDFFYGLKCERRHLMNSYNLPALSGNEWYSLLFVTVTQLDSATAPLASDGAGVEAIATNFPGGTCAMRVEGLLTQGGNVQFDSSVLTTEQRGILTLRHNYKPASVAALIYPTTFRDKGIGGSTPVNWADVSGAGVPALEEFHVFTGAIARGASSLTHPPRSGLVHVAHRVMPVHAPFIVGVTGVPVTAWAQETTNSDINQEGASFAIPLKVKI